MWQIQSKIYEKVFVPEEGGTTPEGSLTLVSNLLLVVVNIGLDILGNLTKLNITKYSALKYELNKLVNFFIEQTLKKIIHNNCYT